MNESLFTLLFLPISLGIIMFGLGLSLTFDDFKRVIKYPKAVVVALTCQMFLLPAICFFLTKVFKLEPALAVGMMLLAASPGGATSNLYSYLAKGDVALNISLTAINSVLSIFILPLIVNLSLNHFMDSGQYVPLQFKKVIEVFAIMLLPVSIGMLVNKLLPGFSVKIHKLVKVVSVLVLIIIIVAILIKENEVLSSNFKNLGLPLLIFNLFSILLGYFIPRLMRIEKKQSISISMEIGIHNGTLAIYVALSVLHNAAMSIPPAIYSILMFFTAALFGYWINRKTNR